MNHDAKVQVAVGTQTDQCSTFWARTPVTTLDASFLPPQTFQPERGSTPSPTDTMEPGEEQPPVAEPSPKDDATMDLDEQELPTAETNVAFPVTSEVCFARHVIIIPPVLYCAY